MKKSIIILLSFLFFSYNAYTNTEIQDFIDIGGGAVFKSNIRIGNTVTFLNNNPIIFPFPLVFGKYKRLILKTPMLYFQLIKKKPFIFSPVLALGMESYNAEGMSKRSASVMGGVSFQMFFFNFEYLLDLINYSNGSIFTLKFERRPFQITPNLTLKLILGMEYQDAKYTNYYYGIKSDEVKVGRPFYQCKDSFNFFAGIVPEFNFAGNCKFRMVFKVKIFGDEISNSPTVDKDTEFTMMLGIVYRFLL